MSSLFDINLRLLQAYEMAESGEYDPETIADTIDGIEWELEEKADNYARLITAINGEVATLEAEEKRLAARRKSKSQFAKRLKSNLQEAMYSAKKLKIKTALFSFNIQKCTPALNIYDESSVPQMYLVYPEPIIDKMALKEALKRGQSVPGAELTQGESLRIR